MLTELLTPQTMHPRTHVHTQYITVLIHTSFPHGMEFADHVNLLQIM